MKNSSSATAEDALRFVVLATLVGGAFWIWTREANPFPEVGASPPGRPPGHPPRRFIRHAGKHSVREMKESIESLEKARREIFPEPEHQTRFLLHEWIYQQQKAQGKKKK